MEAYTQTEKNAFRQVHTQTQKHVFRQACTQTQKQELREAGTQILKQILRETSTQTIKERCKLKYFNKKKNFMQKYRKPFFTERLFMFQMKGKNWGCFVNKSKGKAQNLLKLSWRNSTSHFRSFEYLAFL